MRPCDCEDQYTIDIELTEQGLGFNNEAIMVKGGLVILTLGAQCTVSITRKRFKSFAEWFLTDQKESVTRQLMQEKSEK